jgi:DNA-binding NarL/FixJ family response regulator
MALEDQSRCNRLTFALDERTSKFGGRHGADQVPIPHPLTTLTAREREVLKLVVQGLRNSEICERLHVSIKTVEAHLTSLYQKLGVQSRTEAVTYAREQGLLLDQE